MKKANYIVFDTETGGFSEKENPITQIALVALDHDTLKEIDRFETFIKPYDDLKITKEALAVTGLKMVDINNGVDKKEAVKLITAFAKKNSPNSRPENRPILVGHNVQFDVKMLRSLFERCSKDIFEVFSPTQICTMVLSKMFNPNISSLQLGNCCKEVGITLNGAHRAMNDTLATVTLSKFYINKLRANGTSVAVNVTETKKSRTTFQF